MEHKSELLVFQKEIRKMDSMCAIIQLLTEIEYATMKKKNGHL